MYKKIVGILVVMILVTTAMSVVGTVNEKQIHLNLKIKDYFKKNPTIMQDFNPIDTGGIFIQLPPSPGSSSSSSWVSSSDSGYLCYEDFWNVFDPICDVHWWGNSMYLDGNTWIQLDPEGMTFNISFWDAAGFFVKSYENVTPTIIDTGIEHLSWTGMYKRLYYFETELDPCIELQYGWIGIHSTYCPSGGWFLWMRSFDGNGKCIQEYEGSGTTVFQDLSVVFTNGESANPILECMGNLKLEKVPPSSNVTGSFRVRNHGDATSVLQWRIDNTSLPNWGSNWTFNPSADFQTPDMDWLIVNFSFIAPEDKNTEYTGALKVVNALNSNEYCLVNLSIKTPRYRPYKNILLTPLFERFPNAFPILRQLLGL